MVLAMREGVLPKTLHVDAPSSKVDWEAGEIELLDRAGRAWEANGRPRRAGVSSFGVSGTNAHVILEEAPAGRARPGEQGEDGREGQRRRLRAPSQPQPSSPSRPKQSQPWPRRQSACAPTCKANPDLDPTDVAYSLATTRSAFEHRAVALGSSREELLAALDALAQGKESPNTTKAQAQHRAKPRLPLPRTRRPGPGHGPGPDRVLTGLRQPTWRPASKPSPPTSSGP